MLIITNGEKWHYLAVKSLPAFLRGVTSNNNGDFYYLNCFHSYRTDNKLKKYGRLCNKHDYCYLEMPKEYDKTLKYNYGENSLKTYFEIDIDIKCLIKKHTHAKIILKNVTHR